MAMFAMTTGFITAARAAWLSSTRTRSEDGVTCRIEPWFSCVRLVRCACMFVPILFSPAPATGAEFIPLGGDFHSEANAISDDGSVVVGTNSVAGFFEPFRWTQDTGMESIPWPLPDIDAYANDVSSDGSIVVGAGWDGTLFRWFDGGKMELLGRNTAWEPSASADASVIVGRALKDEKDEIRVATRWTEADRRTVIGPPDFESNASDISDDGVLVAGTTSSPLPVFKRPGRPTFYGQAFVWRQQDGFQLLGGLPGIDLGSKAWAISPDGSTVVGEAKRSPDWPAMDPFLWTKADGMIGLGLLPDRGHGVARDVSTRGSVVVGYSADVDDPSNHAKEKAFIWDKVNGTRSLQTLLEDRGLKEALTDWELTRASAISPDGLHVAGQGLNPFGDFGAWLVHFDKPLFEERLQAGDADQDMDFDQLDLVLVQQSAKYLTGTAATWGEGDWNGAPGGEVDSPPAGNGLFDQLDIISALAPAHYLTGPYGALTHGGMLDDEQTSLVYDATTGELAVDAPESTSLTSINIDSAGSKFIGDKPAVLDGAFDNSSPDNIFKATFGGSFGDITFGNVLPAGMGEADVTADLTAVGSLAGGGDLGNVDLVYVPVPSAFALFGIGFFGALIAGHRRVRDQKTIIPGF